MRVRLRLSLLLRAVLALAGLVPSFLVAVAVLFVLGLVAGAIIMGILTVPLAYVVSEAALSPVVLWGTLLIAVGTAAGSVYEAYVTAHDHHQRVIDATRPLRGNEAAVQEVVTRLARQADLPAPTVRAIDTPDPLVYTVYYEGETVLVLSTGIASVLGADEVEAVMAHELAHVANRDIRLTTLGLVPLLSAEELVEMGVDEDDEDVTFTDDRGRIDVFAVFSYAVGRVLLVVTAVSIALFARGREMAADRGAARITVDPGALASALQRLDHVVERRPSTDLREATRVVNVLSITADQRPEGQWLPDRVRPFATHPSTERRVEHLRRLQAHQETP